MNIYLKIRSFTLNWLTLGARCLSVENSAGFRFQLEAFHVPCHTEVLWYHEIICLWMTIFIYHHFCIGACVFENSSPPSSKGLQYADNLPCRRLRDVLDMTLKCVRLQVSRDLWSVESLLHCLGMDLRVIPHPLWPVEVYMFESRLLLILSWTMWNHDLKAPFSIAPTPRCWEGPTPFPWLFHFTLDPYLKMLTVKQGDIIYHFLSLWYDSTWDWTPVYQTIGEHSTH